MQYSFFLKSARNAVPKSCSLKFWWLAKFNFVLDSVQYRLKTSLPFTVMRQDFGSGFKTRWWPIHFNTHAVGFPTSMPFKFPKSYLHCSYVSKWGGQIFVIWPIGQQVVYVQIYFQPRHILRPIMSLWTVFISRETLAAHQVLAFWSPPFRRVRVETFPWGIFVNFLCHTAAVDKVLVGSAC